MIRLPDVALPAAAQRQLRLWQREINALATYEERVAAAGRRFEARNHGRNPTFRRVRESLTAMCCGARRCAYCEDSAADEVEHFKPKSIYPEACFSWSNYLYACGPCNAPKSSVFAVFSRGTRALVAVARKPGDLVTPPTPGDPVFINPRRDEPLDLLTLDIVDTFWFFPSAKKGTEEFERAEYTIKHLRLNARDYLPRARAQAYGSYRARLKEYILDRDRGAPPERLRDRVLGVKTMDHPTVWAEMKRQSRSIRELRALFRKAPEALSW